MSPLQRIQSLLMSLLGAIRTTPTVDLSVLFDELHDLQTTYYPFELCYHMERIKEEMEHPRDEILDMLYEVDLMLN